MIFRSLGPFLSHHWKLVLVVWGLAFLVVAWTAPAWNDVVRDGEFEYLPQSVPSRVGEAEYQKSFKHDLLGSTAVIVLRRAGREEGLLPEDREFVEDVLKPAIVRIAQAEVEPNGSIANNADNELEGSSIRAVRTAKDRIAGRLLNSSDGKTTLVLVEFTTRFLDRGNWPLLSRIETLIAQEGDLVGQPDNLFARQLIPPGLSLSLSGPAIVGRDLRSHSETSTRSLMQWALLMAVAGLLVFYRAPFLALAPLLAALLSVGMAMAALAHLAGAGLLELFAGLENYLMVILAGASLLSGLVLVARESETRFRCPTLEDATTLAIKRAGPELAGGGLVLLAGWGMLIFAQYGKLQQLGAALVIGAVFVLLTNLTFLPALMALLGRWAFWPNLRSERISADRTWSLPRATWSRLMGRGWSLGAWQAVYRRLEEKPRTILIACLCAMGPFIAVAVLCQGQLTYGLLSQLPEELASVKGAEIIQQQFPAGTTGPVTLLLEHPGLEFHTIEGGKVIGELSDAIEQRKEQFGIADVRSVAFPLGLAQKDVATHTFVERARRHRSAVEYYVGDKPPLSTHATKLEIVFDADPFSRQSIEQFETLRRTLPQLLPPALAEAKWHLLGAPASIRDLKIVTDRDRRLIQSLVIAGVFLCLVCLLRQGALSAGLVGLGLLNFLASMGATFAAFWWGSDGEFPGLDWTVPTLLFVVLMSLAAQGHWWLMLRIREEQRDLGRTAGLHSALQQNGSLFLGSGLIAAGVFASLLGGTLVGLKQFGFGLTCSLLLDALVIRPLLLPVCLLLTSQDQTKGNVIPSVPSTPPAAPTKEILTATVPRLSDE